mmetsp:Transcript_33409/g.78089  ORF Transcript_33409/g.78089 Transcript_33409/m.78089 type:complete len:237 (-) Transcript_33409:51-761(-)
MRGLQPRPRLVQMLQRHHPLLQRHGQAVLRCQAGLGPPRTASWALPGVIMVLPPHPLLQQHRCRCRRHPSMAEVCRLSSWLKQRMDLMALTLKPSLSRIRSAPLTLGWLMVPAATRMLQSAVWLFRAEWRAERYLASSSSNSSNNSSKTAYLTWLPRQSVILILRRQEARTKSEVSTATPPALAAVVVADTLTRRHLARPAWVSLAWAWATTSGGCCWLRLRPCCSQQMSTGFKRP